MPDWMLLPALAGAATGGRLLCSRSRPDRLDPANHPLAGETVTFALEVVSVT